MARLGGDIEGMDQLQGQLRQRSGEIQQLRSGLSNMVQNTYWEGPAAARFKSEWSGQYSTSLQNLEKLLEELSAEVQRRKQALIDVSN